MTGLSSTLAVIGLVFVLVGAVFLAARRRRKIAITCLIIGLMLIFVPYIWISLLD